MEGSTVRKYTLALDPGKKSGWATYEHDTRTFRSGEADFAETCKILLEPRKDEQFGIQVLPYEMDIVCESFIITVNTAKNTQATWSLELIGVARMCSELWGLQPLTLQQPASAKRMVSDEMLRSLDWYRPGRGHANDAARHLGLYLLSRGWMDDRVKAFVASH